MATKVAPVQFIRRRVRALHPYVPGEQPKVPGLVKLNTNENPYPPAPQVLAAIKAAVDGRLRLYPNPACDALRARLAKLYGCHADNIIVGNGSDELLALAVRAFVEPRPLGTALHSSPHWVVQYFDPSYSLYPVLSGIHGAQGNPVELNPDFSLPSLRDLKLRHSWDFRAALSFITSPNAPSGRGYATAELEKICRVQRGVVVLDEAYVDFANENAMHLATRCPNVLVARTFSKAYSLCFQRVGYMVGHPELIAALHKIRDSYNVNGLGQIAAEATLDYLEYYQLKFREIIATRERLSAQLGEMMFEVCPSQTNFILVRPPMLPARQWLEGLRARKVLVRWFSGPNVRHYLRITIGTPEQAGKLLNAVKAILKSVARAPAPVQD